MKEGRGLRTAFPDIIPLERPDVLDDLKSLVDVHRLTDFTLHDRVVPTIELRRTEDELILAFVLGPLVGVAAQFLWCQLFNGTADKVLRPLTIYAENLVGPQMDLSFDTVAVGVPTVPTPVDRRRVGGPFVINAGTVGSFRSSSAVAVPGSGAAFSLVSGAGLGGFFPAELLRTMALPPQTAINIAAGAVNQGILVAMAYKVEPMNKTRAQGL